MKNIAIVLAFTFIGSFSFAQENNTWRWGVQLGIHGVDSKYAGGDVDANARFHHNDFGTGALSFIGRYDFDNHWKIESGLGFSSIGFEDALAENYSLLSPESHFTQVRSSIGTVEVPLMISYKFNPNCKNWKWFVSGGVASVLVGDVTKGNEVSKSTDGPTNVVYLSNTVSGNKGTHLNLRFAVGREKVYQSGRIFSWSLVWNAGFDQLAKSTVKYTIDAKEYQHEFATNGNYFGFRLAYFFKPLNNIQSKTKPNSASVN